MRVYFKDRKLYFREFCSTVSNLLEWESKEESEVQSLLFTDEEGLYTYDGLYKLLKDKVNLELENPYSIDQRVSVSNDFLDNITLFDFQTNAISKCLTLKRGVVDSVTGCFTGDTKVSLVVGGETPIKDLVGRKEFMVYSCTSNGEVVLGRGHSARVTKFVDILLEVTLDNDDVVECTSDHRFMLKNGTYKKAVFLKENDVLMPLFKGTRCIIKEIRQLRLRVPIPVYDITVDKYHNFALSLGFFVHNSGKTELIIGCLRHLLDQNVVNNAVIVVPSVGLATQLQERAFKRGFSKEEIGVIGGGLKELEAKIKVSVVNSLYNGVKKYRNGEENALFDIISTADFLALDEGHHSSAESWKSLVLEAKRAKYVLAFSGSPFSEDDILESYEDSLFFGLFNGVIVKIPTEIPMKLGLIATPVLHFHTIRAKKLHRYRGMWHHVYKTFIVKNSQRNNIIKEYARKFTLLGFQTLILVTQLEHAKILMQLLKNFSPVGIFGGSLGLSIDSESGLIEEYSLDYNIFRENLIKGHYKIVIGSPCLDEGFDMPSVGLVVMAGAQKSKKKVIQRLGRGLRRKSEGPNQVYVLDFNDLTHVYLSSQSKKRNKIYTELGVIKESYEDFIKQAINHNKF